MRNGDDEGGHGVSAAVAECGGFVEVVREMGERRVAA
jgi:hypothetical protein